MNSQSADTGAHRAGKEGHQDGRTPERFEVTLDELRQMRHRINDQQLEPGDWLLLGALVAQQIGRAEARQERMLKKIAAAAHTATGEAAEDESGAVHISELTSNPSSSGATAAIERAPETPAFGGGEADQSGPKKAKGHGRNGAGAYRKAKHFFHTLAAGVLGAVCEVCIAGKLYRYREKVTVRIIGQPLFCAEVHHYEQVRCRNCGRIIRATGFAEVQAGLGSDYVRYDWSACAMLMVMHYSAGGPFKRLESLHEGWGIPLADANQWDVVNAGDDLLLPLFRALEHHAIATATNFRADDANSMVVAIQKQIEAEIAALRQLGESTSSIRTGINATGFYWETPNGPVILYYTGRHHAGEMVDQLLRRRLLSSPKLVKCTDGASKNFDHGHGDKLVEATCNAHAFLKFRDVREKYPADYAEAGSIYHQVFENDDKARDFRLSPLERMHYHREHSLPLMKRLKEMCEEKIQSKLVEPNSALWEPLTFIINQWDRLTRFCEVPGVPLDTNLVEQVLIMAVRYLAGSFNYQTEDGAAVGDRAMSLIATARAHGVEPVAYLTECLRCHEDLKKRPEHYLPWVFRARMQEGDSPPVPAPEPAEPELQSLDSEPARKLGDLAKEVRECAALRVAAPEQNLEFASQQG